MATFYHNVSGELVQELIAVGEDTRVSSISLTNVHANTSCKADLYIKKKLTGTFYVIKGVELPVGATLNSGLNFNNSATGFGLYIKLTKGETFTLTGTIDPAASVTVPGVSTLFLTEVSIGDEIVVSGETRTISAIASNTSLTVSSAFSNNANDTTPDCNPEALVDVVIK